MPCPVVRYLVVVELEGELDRAEALFREFQECVEGGIARAVGRASLEDLEEFAPDVVALKPGRIDVHIPPIAAVNDDPDIGDDDDNP